MYIYVYFLNIYVYVYMFMYIYVYLCMISFLYDQMLQSVYQCNQNHCWMLLVSLFSPALHNDLQ